jgi:hypothetical protein
LHHLEARETPASAVNAVLSGTTLLLTGTDDNDAIQLKQSPAGIEVTGLNATTVTGGAQPFAGVTAIKAAMLDGDDAVFLDPTSGLTLSGVSTFDLGGGDNQLQLATSSKLDFGGLTVLAGDGADTVQVAGGVGLGNTVKGNLSFALGIGKNSQDPPYLDTQVTVQNVNVQGLGGIKLTGAEGDEVLTLQNVIANFALNANGGDGALVVNTTASHFGSVTLNSVGPAHGVSTNGTWLTATDTGVTGTLTVKSANGVHVELTDGATGSIAVTGGPLADTELSFSGTPTVNGNVTVKGFHHTVAVQSDGMATVTGNVLITATGSASLRAADGLLKARNVTVTGIGGGSVDFFAFDAGNGGPVPGVTTTGSLTMRGRDVQYIQQSGQVAVGTAMNLLGTEETTVSTGQGFHSSGPVAQTTVTGPVMITGRHVEYTQSESGATYKAAVTIQGAESASVTLLPWQLDGDPNNPDSPPFGNGATVSVAGLFTIKGRDANYTQKEGVATFGALTIQATESAAFDSEPKNFGIDPNGASVFGLGATTTVNSGALTMTGRSAEYFQAEGGASFARGLSLIAKGSASLRTEADPRNVETPFGAKLEVPGGGILVQGGDAELTLQDGDTTVSGGVTVRGLAGGQFDLETYDSADQGNLTVGGALAVTGGAGEVQFSGFGNSLQVDGDVSIAGAGLNRIWFDPATGTEIGGNLKASGATGDRDFFLVGSDLTVAGDTSVSLGGGANAIEFGVDGGIVQLNGNLTLTTGNGSDVIDLVSTTVAGTTTINTGAGSDQLHFLKDTVFNGAVNVDLGGGADTFEAGLPLVDPFGPGIPAGPVTFNAAARVLMGTGNNTLRLGVAGDPDGKVLFGAGGTLFVDGGLNLNLFDPQAGQFDPAKVTALHFVDPTP